MAYLVYIGTVGSEEISHFVADKIVAPPEQQHTHSEKFAIVPNSFFVNSHAALMFPPGVVSASFYYNPFYLSSTSALYAHLSHSFC